MTSSDLKINKNGPIYVFYAFLGLGMIVLFFQDLMLPGNDFGLIISTSVLSSNFFWFLDFFPFYNKLKSMPASEYVCRYMYIMNGFSIIFSVIISTIFSFIVLFPSKISNNFSKERTGDFTFYLLFLLLSIAGSVYVLHDDNACVSSYTGYMKRKMPFHSSVFIYSALYGVLSLPALLIRMSKDRHKIDSSFQN